MEASGAEGVVVGSAIVKLIEETKGDMPPFGARKDSWGLDAQLTVSEWFETGAARGD